MDLFFNPTLTKKTLTVELSSDESFHLAKVLRKKEDQSIRLTNGNGIEWKGILTRVNQKACEAKCVEIIEHHKPNYSLHLGVAPTKNMQRFEWLIEKATEIGVTKITPILCQFSERKIIKHERLQKIIVAALKQSQQFYLPHLGALTPYEEFLHTIDRDGFIAHCYPTPKILLDNINSKDLSKNIHLLIGPEGDFSQEEVQKASTNKIQAVSLGETRLRTETAGLIAAHSLLLKLKEHL
tara:strand:+ start:1251 stop:1967 length:717 start_codon:yes stop_codon:yes gene_type:complete